LRIGSCFAADLGCVISKLRGARLRQRNFGNRWNRYFRRSLARMQALALFCLDHVNRHLEPVAMMSHGFAIGDILLA
jgi:hypothetical protein